ncbi:MAG: amino acid racemase [Tissierellia bacterium]|nr:amino acid racemase [Tissierellia bacterium]
MKTIGILGGMGPLATVDLFQKIVLHTNAKNDQDHIPMIIDNNTRIPDRTESILNKDGACVKELFNSCHRLEKAGVDFIIIACNTSHYYYDELIKYTSTPILHMPRITAKKVKKKGIKKVGILGSIGTMKVGLYQHALKEVGVEYLVPNTKEQNMVHDLIYKGVKAGYYPKDGFGMEKVLESLKEQGAEAFILGCTELPLGMENYPWEYTWIDPTLELAKEAILFAGGTWI